jgi:TRAP-type mannitol/chloroaromatic compound transport system substrate-binding protein
MTRRGLTFALPVALSLILGTLLPAPGFAQKEGEKFGVDKRAQEWKRKRFKTSQERIRWKMVETWNSGNLFHDIANHFCDSVRATSGGRLDIRLYEAGALVPALQTFDAVSKGTVECGHAVPVYWKGKNEAIVLFGSAPYGLDFEGYNIWLYERGGLEMWNDIYAEHGMVVFPCGNAGQELGLFSNKKAEKMADFKGMRIRTVGWYMDILNRLGASAQTLPGSEVYPALERGVIDACEFSSPAIDLPLGFHEITDYCIQPGVHQPSVQCELMINKEKWNALPEDLQNIVKICAKETQLWSNGWIENLNIEAIKEFRKHVEFVKMDDETLIGFRKVAHEYLEEVKKEFPDVRRVLESQEKYMREMADWRDLRGRVAPWPYETYVEGRLTQ